MAKSPIFEKHVDKPKAARVYGAGTTWALYGIGILATVCDQPVQAMPCVVGGLVLSAIRSIEEQRRLKEGWTDE